MVNAKISCLSILTPCSECEDGDENDGGDEKISCLDKFGKETCVNHGDYVIYNLTYLKSRCKIKFISNKLYLKFQMSLYMNHHRTSFPQMQIQEMVRHVLIFFKADPNSISI